MACDDGGRNKCELVMSQGRVTYVRATKTDTSLSLQRGLEGGQDLLDKNLNPSQVFIYPDTYIIILGVVAGQLVIVNELVNLSKKAREYGDTNASIRISWFSP